MRLFRIFLPLFLSLFCVGSANSSERDVLVFAAASMADVMGKIAKQYEQACDCRVQFSFAASSILARQIEVGAPADLYISANRQWVDWLEERKAIYNEPQVIAGNQLVIASSAKTKDSFNILWRGRFSMGDPYGVPAGIYARQALEKMGIWEKVKSNAVFTENVRVALSMVARGDLLSGIVYKSDLEAARKLHAHFTFPENTHGPIEYLAALTRENHKGSENLLAFMVSSEGQEIFEASGFLRAVK